MPLRRAIYLFFRGHVRVKFRGGLRVSLDERRSERMPSPESLARAQARNELKQMLLQLAEVLDEMPDVRESLRHLVFVEQAVREQGLAALHSVPLDVLQQALDQFEGLVTNWSPVGLAALRSKMAVALSERTRYAAVSTQAAPAAPPAREPVSASRV